MFTYLNKTKKIQLSSYKISDIVLNIKFIKNSHKNIVII